MKVLIACEYSGIVRDAFILRGHDAISCDFLPSERPGPHVQGDVRPLLRRPWDLVVAFPPCTYLCNSGVRWLYERPGRWEQMRVAALFFSECLNANADRVACENPVMHRYGSEIIGRGPDFTVQPWHFGDAFTKRTAFWCRNLSPLVPDPGNVLDRHRAVSACHLEPPGPDRWKNRSRTFPGIANAIAEQWSFPWLGQGFAF